MNKLLKTLALLLLLGASTAQADRIKDLVSIAANRGNQLIGYGLVVGLQGTGDGTDLSFTTQSMKTLLNRMGVNSENPLTDFEAASSGSKIDLKSGAAVITADLPGMAKPGQRIDINVSAIGKATSLRGGNLLLTSLRGADGEIYALAQSALMATSASASAAGSSVSTGVTTSTRIPGGATVEKVVENSFDKTDNVLLNLRESD